MPQRREFPGKKGAAIWLSKQELQEFLTLADTQDKEIIFTLLSAGLRVDEACNASSDDLFEDVRGLMLRVRGKGDKYREVPVPPQLKMASFPILRQWKGKKKPISTNTALKWVKQAGEAMDIPDLSPHDIRRTYASLLLKAGVSPETIMLWGGWESWETFRQHYMNLSDVDFQAEERDRLHYYLNPHKLESLEGELH